jgi:hypothetical protein
MASLNPFKAIEELITEHGSAAIQGKHIAFLRDQIVELKAQFLKLEQENAVLLSRVSDLQSKLEAFEAKAKEKPGVACVAAPILEALHVSGPLLTIREICEATGIAADEVEHMWAGNLEGNGFVEILKDDAGSLVSMTILDDGRNAWIRHRKFMETVE